MYILLPKTELSFSKDPAYAGSLLYRKIKTNYHYNVVGFSLYSRTKTRVVLIHAKRSPEDARDELPRQWRMPNSRGIYVAKKSEKITVNKHIDEEKLLHEGVRDMLHVCDEPILSEFMKDLKFQSMDGLWEEMITSFGSSCPHVLLERSESTGDDSVRQNMVELPICYSG
jgi:hypothetical protein